MTYPDTTTLDVLKAALDKVVKTKSDFILMRDGLNKSIELLFHDEIALQRAIAAQAAEVGDD